MYTVDIRTNGNRYVIHDPLSEDTRIYNDELKTETNEPGEFKFTLGTGHPSIPYVLGMRSDIRVYEDGEEIWRGRPIDDGEDLYKARTFVCEGELAFLYDSIQPRRELHDITPQQFLQILLTEHNRQVVSQGDIDKTFYVGRVTVLDPNNSIYRYTNRETTFDCIKDKLIGRLGGHLAVREVNGVRYIDYLADVDTVGTQPIQLGDNLLDYAKDTDYTEIATACIPLGALLEETEIPALDAYLTVEDVNGGSDTITIPQAVQTYGKICKVVHFDDITTPQRLMTAGQAWLTAEQYETLTIELTAVDLHTLGEDIDALRINTQARFVSPAHGMDTFFPITERTYHLSEPERDTVKFGGSSKPQTYTGKSGKTTGQIQAHAEQLRHTIDGVIADTRQEISDKVNAATHGYVVMDPTTGPERILVMDANSTSQARKIWKWDMSGFAYSKSGINGPWGTAITMDGEISADYILTGELNASLIKAGIISDINGLNSWDMESGDLTIQTGTINLGNGAFTVSNTGSMHCSDADIEGSVFSGDRTSFWLSLNGGRLSGGYQGQTAGYIDCTAIIPDPSVGTRRGLLLKGNGMEIHTNRLAVGASDDVSTVDGYGWTGRARINVNGTDKLVDFIHGIMVTDLAA